VSDHRDYYRDRKVLVTGGLGFIGSNLCRTLADLGAQVTAVDSLLPDYGGNLFNLVGYV
jgi:UDP-glucose 4-epimerase